MKKEHRILKTIAALLVMLFFCALGGTITTIYSFSAPITKIILATCIISSGCFVILFYRLRKIPLAELGLAKPQKKTIKFLLFLIPMFVVALSTLCGGINPTAMSIFYANFLLAVAAGFTEEIYFRGIILHLWEKKNIRLAVILSALLFGLSHMANVLGGADFGYTALQMIFAYFIGLTLALITLVTKSILPCMLIHFFQDLCAFSGNDISRTGEIILLIILIAILIGYSIYIIKKSAVLQQRSQRITS